MLVCQTCKYWPCLPADVLIRQGTAGCGGACPAAHICCGRCLRWLGVDHLLLQIRQGGGPGKLAACHGWPQSRRDDVVGQPQVILNPKR